MLSNTYPDETIVECLFACQATYSKIILAICIICGCLSTSTYLLVKYSFDTGSNNQNTILIASALMFITCLFAVLFIMLVSTLIKMCVGNKKYDC